MARRTALTVAAIAYLVSTSLAQNGFIIGVLAPNDPTLNGLTLTGYHVGAALSYLVAGTGHGEDGFFINDTAHQLQDSDIAEGYNLPCYVVSDPDLSSNAGPLECGADTSTTNYGYAYSGTHVLGIEGVSGGWFLCGVQSLGYGVIEGTVVGVFRSGTPTGSGIQNCTAIDGLQFGGVDTTTSISSSAISNSTSTPYSSLVNSTEITYPTYVIPYNSTCNSTTSTVIYGGTTTEMCDCEKTPVTSYAGTSTVTVAPAAAPVTTTQMETANGMASSTGSGAGAGAGTAVATTGLVSPIIQPYATGAACTKGNAWEIMIGLAAAAIAVLL